MISPASAALRAFASSFSSKSCFARAPHASSTTTPPSGWNPVICQIERRPPPARRRPKARSRRSVRLVTDRRAPVETADQVEEELTAGLREGYRHRNRRGDLAHRAEPRRHRAPSPDRSAAAGGDDRPGCRSSKCSSTSCATPPRRCGKVGPATPRAASVRARMRSRHRRVRCQRPARELSPVLQRGWSGEGARRRSLAHDPASRGGVMDLIDGPLNTSRPRAAVGQERGQLFKLAVLFDAFELGQHRLNRDASKLERLVQAGLVNTHDVRF
jgi:hypothetical protein